MLYLFQVQIQPKFLHHVFLRFFYRLIDPYMFLHILLLCGAFKYTENLFLILWFNTNSPCNYQFFSGYLKFLVVDINFSFEVFTKLLFLIQKFLFQVFSLSTFGNIMPYNESTTKCIILINRLYIKKYPFYMSILSITLYSISSSISSTVNPF